MCQLSYEYFHPKIAAQSCLNRADRLVHGDTSTILAFGSMVRFWPTTARCVWQSLARRLSFAAPRK